MEYINKPQNTMPIAIRVFGAHTGIGVGLSNFLGSGLGSVAYNLAYLTCRAAVCEIFCGSLPSRKHCLNGEDILYNNLTQSRWRKGCDRTITDEDRTPNERVKQERGRMQRASEHEVILDGNVRG